MGHRLPHRLTERTESQSSSHSHPLPHRAKEGLENHTTYVYPFCRNCLLFILRDNNHDTQRERGQVYTTRDFSERLKQVYCFFYVVQCYHLQSTTVGLCLEQAATPQITEVEFCFYFSCYPVSRVSLRRQWAVISFHYPARLGYFVNLNLFLMCCKWPTLSNVSCNCDLRKYLVNIFMHD